ncbi:LysR family transcriptional regulator [Burkholderia ubonensis]|uniref:immunity 52 family protein n=1 Tax=Burkholderia ubonensis TaxID=101571 RepID=UPI00075A2FC5|nr:immunity 52 family protein [Burkholderia ubonensis]KVO21278.1 LysR family transcriptional regulator [Burkholderia ubonensis]KVO25049.1 LysR family transcriptional regulator [Burkholderia ubonensis]KVP62784.1 LysR family transcriptional regulator [Burkholderia ubonensis]KVQ68302.1 LysR family transcriptional regulator [Burkholderia ubonensis]KVR09336.1 LysR family transcriptional regulator [Burkholderia ubonensis]
MDISLLFRDESLAPTDFEKILSRIYVVTSTMGEIDSTLSTWFAQGDTLDEALLYPAFEDGQPSTALLAVLRQQFSDDPSLSYVALWNGNQNKGEGATIACHVGENAVPHSLEIKISSPMVLGNLASVQRIMSATVAAFQPACVSVSPRSYATKQVFDDKPGVGWMIYLPTVITQQQVPEAREIIPVPEAGKTQTGTIVVSTTDAPFSMKNPEHIETANRIEVRLVDHDLLPAFAGL